MTAPVRSEAKARPLLPGAKLVEGDARDAAAVTRALDGCEAVISALGPRTIRLIGEVTLMSEATRILVAAMRERGVGGSSASPASAPATAPDMAGSPMTG